MRVEKVPLDQAVGHILLHNQIGSEGRKVLKKGHLLTEADLPALQAVGQTEVYVAILTEEDIPENEAARRLGEVIAGDHLVASTATTGRVNLMAAAAGLFKVNRPALLEFNDRPGITLATIPDNSLIQPKKIVATIKIIPYSVPRPELAAAEAVVRAGQPLVQVKPFVVRRAVLITTGSQAARQNVLDSFTPALRDRLTSYQADMVEGPYVPEDEARISAALQWALEQGAELIVIAGETSIMDLDDLTPRAIKAVGGELVHHGVPVEPGNLLLLAYIKDVPVVGAPGCARSKNYNVVDMVLPRLAVGERLTRRDLIELGHGGLLK
mgnify:CR=1 FL=1